MKRCSWRTSPPRPRILPAGTIDRDPQGVPTGVLKESAMDAVLALIPPPTPEQWRNGILRMVDTLHREGMTAVKDPDIQPPIWDAYRQLLEEKKLTVHVCVLWHGGTTLESARAALARIQALPRPPDSLGDGNLLSCGAKLYMDGSGGARTAWVYKEWNKNSTGIDQGNHGYPLTDPEVYRQMVRLFHQAGVSVGTHAIGDHAIDWVVDTYAQVLKEKPTPGLRHSIIHANIPTDHAIDTMAFAPKEYDAGYPESQPPFTWWIGDTYAGNFGPRAFTALESLPHLPVPRDYLGRGLGLLRDPIAGALRALGVGGARNRQGRLRKAALRNGGVGRCAYRASLLHRLGRPAIVSGKQVGSSNPAKKRISPFGIRTCTPSPPLSCAT
jgi:hypothetical protein